MMRSVAIFGLNGAGKSTLAHALAQATGRFEMDVEDYYFPHQRLSRARALDGLPPDDAPFIPYESSCTQQEVAAMLLQDMDAHPAFILAGVTMSWPKTILRRVDIAFLVQAPLEVRLARIQAREAQRFGQRVLPGGDMHLQQTAFRSMVTARSADAVLASAKKFACPVIVLDGTLPIRENVGTMLQYLQ